MLPVILSVGYPPSGWARSYVKWAIANNARLNEMIPNGRHPASGKGYLVGHGIHMTMSLCCSAVKTALIHLHRFPESACVSGPLMEEGN